MKSSYNRCSLISSAESYTFIIHSDVSRNVRFTLLQDPYSDQNSKLQPLESSVLVLRVGFRKTKWSGSLANEIDAQAKKGKSMLP